MNKISIIARLNKITECLHGLDYEEVERESYSQAVVCKHFVSIAIQDTPDMIEVILCRYPFKGSHRAKMVNCTEAMLSEKFHKAMRNPNPQYLRPKITESLPKINVALKAGSVFYWSIKHYEE